MFLSLDVLLSRCKIIRDDTVRLHFWYDIMLLSEHSKCLELEQSFLYCIVPTQVEVCRSRSIYSYGKPLLLPTHGGITNDTVNPIVNSCERLCTDSTVSYVRGRSCSHKIINCFDCQISRTSCVTPCCAITVKHQTIEHYHEILSFCACYMDDSSRGKSLGK